MMRAGGRKLASFLRDGSGRSIMATQAAHEEMGTSHHNPRTRDEFRMRHHARHLPATAGCTAGVPRCLTHACDKGLAGCSEASVRRSAALRRLHLLEVSKIFSGLALRAANQDYDQVCGPRCVSLYTFVKQQRYHRSRCVALVLHMRPPSLRNTTGTSEERKTKTPKARNLAS